MTESNDNPLELYTHHGFMTDPGEQVDSREPVATEDRYTAACAGG